MANKKKSGPYRRHGFQRPRRTWRTKFADAFLGMGQSLYQQNSFQVHFLAAVAVLLLGWYLGRFDTVRWCLLVLCIVMVVGGEMLNTSIETLARAITSEYDPLIGRALNIASGAILVLSFGAAVVGVILFWEAVLT